MSDDPPSGPYAQLLDAYWQNSPYLHSEHGMCPAKKSRTPGADTRLRTTMMVLACVTIFAAFAVAASG
ncbi:hypothetical protein [Streptomyces sp. S.PB5]|uniref:hypothetical protein n=1 Tax=Streptomyces sp. S.PB5 TaxID=3020844 RepID=UPI0025B246FE|nr:hypothetical protein [Streptomyces sp. S.PB5]MDN3022755.1 hypothetical protein [Streptomyces sp. S.PB5]